MLKHSRFFSLLVNFFPFVRELRLRKKIRHRRRHRGRKRFKDEPRLRRSIMRLGTTRRL